MTLEQKHHALPASHSSQHQCCLLYTMGANTVPGTYSKAMMHKKAFFSVAGGEVFQCLIWLLQYLASG